MSGARDPRVAAADGAPAKKDAAPRMTHAAFRGVGLLLLTSGVVVALLGAARLSLEPAPVSGTGGPAAWQSRPSAPLFGTGVGLMLAAMGLLRWHRRGEADLIGDGATTQAECQRLFATVRAVQSGLPGVPQPTGSMIPALDVLASASAPGEDAAYLLWLKLQLDPVLDEIFPVVMASRDAFRKRHGVPAFAHLFGELAYAERLLCRVWSAAVDGYADEARDSLAAAVAQLAEAERALPAASSPDAGAVEPKGSEADAFVPATPAAASASRRPGRQRSP